MTKWAAEERAALVAALRQLGPDRPTLCEGWTTADMAAHLYVREHRPDAALGVLPLGPLSAYNARVMNSALRTMGFERLLTAISSPPLLWKPVDEAVNTVEYFVHTEDVRRPNGLPVRDLPDELEQALWKRAARQARLAFRRVPARVRLVPDRAEPVEVGKDGPLVEVRGRPSELLLLEFNRKDAVEVEVVGDKQTLWSAKIGL